MIISNFLLLPFLMPVACGDKDDTATVQPWESAPLVDISGTCPTIDASGDLMSMTSNGEERHVRFVLPETPSEDMRVVFFFHGLMPEGSNPTGQMVSGLGLQDLADSHNAIVVLPESSVWELMGNRFHLWSIEQGTEDNDLQLYDDLRSCLHAEFPSDSAESIDLDALVSVGFSGGALFNTLIISQRSETLAASVVMSGGADLEVATFSNLFAPFSPPTNKVPVLLFSGGTQDVWPNASFPVVDFTSGTAYLFNKLQENDIISVLCTHNAGHTITNRSYTQSIEWLTEHRYGEASSFESPIDSWTDWCTWGE